jgi:hypothetical protein
LPPGTTSAHSDEWKIANALSAGPVSITEHAAVMDWPTNPKDGMSHGRVLRQGTNGWTCMPDVPGRPQHDPMCVDETMMKWLMATGASSEWGDHAACAIGVAEEEAGANRWPKPNALL